MSNTANSHNAYIALGSNMGDREQLLKKAVQLLAQHPEIIVTAVSNLYETDPVGYTDQDAFLNMVVEIKTTITAEKLLLEQLQIENQLGRIRNIRWGPRTIDLDLLMYDNMTLETELLILPHPRMMERAFVLVPLHDVLTNNHPLYDEVSHIAKEALLNRKEGIMLWKTINWHNE